VLTSCGAITRKAAKEQVITAIIRLDKKRIVARIRSALGYLPSCLGSGKRGTAKVAPISDVAAKMTRASANTAVKPLVNRFTELQTQLIEVNSLLSWKEPQPGSDKDISSLRNLVKACYDFATDCGRHRLADTFAAAGLGGHQWTSDKSISQVDKIGAYWRIAGSMTEAFHKDGPLAFFSKLAVVSVSPYKPARSPLSMSGKCIDCHVHAEVQMVIHYMLTDQGMQVRPRAIGVSKDSCLLCFFFLGFNGSFRAPPTHGLLYEQWTIPDLKNLTKRQRLLLRATIAWMNQKIQTLANQRHPFRKYALQSKHNFRDLPPASTTASAASLSRLPGIVEALEPAAVPRNEPVEVDASAEVPLAGKEESPGTGEQGSIDTLTIQDTTNTSSAATATGPQWQALTTRPERLKTLEIAGVEVYAEAEPGCRARARAGKSHRSPTKVSTVDVDIGALGEGQEMLLEKAEEHHSLVLLLSDNTGSSTRCCLELEWVAEQC
jgi:OTT_1508-like deaminase